MIKVLYLIDTLETGGAEKSLVAIASKFRDVTPVFIQIYPGSGLKDVLINNNIEVHDLQIAAGYNFREAVNKLIPLVQKIRPDIIHTTLFKSDIIGRKLKKHYNVPLVNSLVNNSYIKERYKNLDFISKVKLYLVQQYDNYTSNNVDLFISNSRAIKETNSVALKIPNNKIKVIHRGRELSDFQKIESLREENLIAELELFNKTIFLNVSRLLERKGQLDLLKAFKIFKANHPNAILLIAGEGSYRLTLEDYILKNELTNSVRLIGNRNDIPVLLSVADYFVFPSWYEGLPGALIEAMMSNTPIIASNIPENLECIDENCAEIFEKGNVDSLIQGLGNALSDKKLITEKAEKAKDIAIKKFSISNIAEEYENTYRTLILKK
tara:strand:+ start:816 stop:1958 length:1143 start_codon:yes stop_codon:yes gene_type:complete